MMQRDSSNKHFEHFRKGEFKAAKTALQQFAKLHPLKRKIPNSSIYANEELIDYYSKSPLIPEEYLKALIKLKNEAAKHAEIEDEKGKDMAEDSALGLFSKENVTNHVVEYNIAVLYSYTKNFAFAIDYGVRLFSALNPEADPFLFFKTGFFLVDMLLSVKEDEVSAFLLEMIEEQTKTLAAKINSLPAKHSDTTNSKESKKYMCLLIGAYIEEATPEFRSTHELELLCKIYRAKWYILTKNLPQAKELLKGSRKVLKSIMSNSSYFPPSMSKAIHSQYAALLHSVKAEQALLSNTIPRAIQLITKNKEQFPVHSSQAKPLKELAQVHNFSHPIHQFNNLGVFHLKMKKYALALTYFESAFKCLPNLKNVTLSGASPVE